MNVDRLFALQAESRKQEIQKPGRQYKREVTSSETELGLRAFWLYLIAIVSHLITYFDNISKNDSLSFKGFLYIISLAAIITALASLPLSSWNWERFFRKIFTLIPVNVLKNVLISLIVYLISLLLKENDGSALFGIYILFGYPILIAQTIHRNMKKIER